MGPRSLLDKLEIGRVKKAGLFLEDIRIFLSGFSEKDETQMQRVLQSAGAKRMNQIAASVTHIGKGVVQILRQSLNSDGS